MLLTMFLVSSSERVHLKPIGKLIRHDRRAAGWRQHSQRPDPSHVKRLA